MKFSSIYFSRLLGNKVHGQNAEIIGTLKDLAVVSDQSNPSVKAAVVKTKEGIKYLSWEHFSVVKEKGQYTISCGKVEERSAEELMFLKKHVLDKQIIDVNGRKVVRVNDIRMVLLTSAFLVVAVDVGAEGMLRRLEIAKPLKKLGFKIPSKLILWNEVETLFTNRNIQLTKAYSKLSTLHPSDLADIIEDFDAKTGMIIFSSLDNAKAADVLEELEEDAQVKLLKNMDSDKVADILEEMPADEVADILDGLHVTEAEELLNNMEKEASDEVRELMEYEEGLVGSIMTTDYYAYSQEATVHQVIEGLKQNPLEEPLYYIYVVDKENKLVGTVSLMDLLTLSPLKRLKDIMKKDFMFAYDDGDLEELIRFVMKYNLIAVPIVTIEMEIVGNVIVNDIVHELVKSRKKIV